MLLNEVLIAFAKSLLKGASTIFFTELGTRIMTFLFVGIYWFGWISLPTLVILEVFKLGIVLGLILVYYQSQGILQLSGQGTALFKEERFKEIAQFGA